MATARQTRTGSSAQCHMACSSPLTSHPLWASTSLRDKDIESATSRRQACSGREPRHRCIGRRADLPRRHSGRRGNATGQWRQKKSSTLRSQVHTAQCHSHCCKYQPRRACRRWCLGWERRCLQGTECMAGLSRWWHSLPGMQCSHRRPRSGRFRRRNGRNGLHVTSRHVKSCQVR